MRNYTIEFDPKDHIYKVDGVIKPSVTTIISKILFPTQYAYVKRSVLDEAASFGESVHIALMQDFPDPLDEEAEKSYTEAVNILRQWGFEPIFKEKKVYSKLGFTGTLDLYADMGDGRKALIDYKTTSTLNKEYVSWQLSMYKVALEEMGHKVHGLYAIHIPRNKKGKLVNIPIKDKIEIEWLIAQYQERAKDE